MAGCDYVCRSIRTGAQIAEIKRGFKRACYDAGIEDFTFHDLRHTWATRAAQAGADAFTSAMSSAMRPSA